MRTCSITVAFHFFLPSPAWFLLLSLIAGKRFLSSWSKWSTLRGLPGITSMELPDTVGTGRMSTSGPIPLSPSADMVGIVGISTRPPPSTGCLEAGRF